MSTTIKKVSEELFDVNGKKIIRDMCGNWISDEELTLSEHRAFKAHLKAVENDINRKK